MSEEPATYRQGPPPKEAPPPKRFSLLRPFDVIPKAIWWFLDEHGPSYHRNDYGTTIATPSAHTFLYVTFVFLVSIYSGILALVAFNTPLSTYEVIVGAVAWIPIIGRYCIRKMFFLDDVDTRAYWRRKLLGDDA